MLTVLCRLLYPFGERRPHRSLAAPTLLLFRLMLGHVQSQKLHLEYLPLAYRFDRNLAQVMLAVRAALHLVNHPIIWLRRQLQCLPVATGLSAAVALSFFPVALRRWFLHPIAARRLAAVAIVFGKLCLQVSDLCAQSLNHLLLADNRWQFCFTCLICSPLLLPISASPTLPLSSYELNISVFF